MTGMDHSASSSEAISEEILDSRELQVLNAIPEKILVTGLDGKILFLNRKARETLCPDCTCPPEFFFDLIAAASRPGAEDFLNSIAINGSGSSNFTLCCCEGQFIETETHASKAMISNQDVLIFSLRDITSSIELQETLIREKNFGSLVLDISARLMNCPSSSLDAEIELALMKIGMFSDARRTYLYLPFKGEDAWANTHEWCREGIDSLIHRLSYLRTADFPGWVETLKRNGCIDWGDPSLLPDEMSSVRDLIRGIGVKSLLAVPMMRNSELCGFLGLESDEVNKQWPSNAHEILTIAGGIIYEALERKQFEDAIKRTNERLMLATTGAGIGLWDWNVQTNQFEFNDQWANILGLDPGKLKRNLDDISKLTHPEDLELMWKDLKEHFESDDGFFRREIRMKDSDDQWHWVLVAGKLVVRDAQGNPLRMSGIHVDVNALKERERILTELIASRDIMLSTIAHDLRNPFSTLLGMASQLAMNRIPQSSTERLAGAYRLIFDSARRCNALLEDLLDWARTRTGSHEPHPTPQDLSQVMANAEELLRETALAKNIMVQIEIPQATLVVSDHNMTSSIFRNLLSNAIKFSHPGGNILIRAEREGDMVVTTVSDSGVGIPPERLQDIFKFERIRSTPGTSGEPGTGLGLILCREFANKNKGDILVESIPDQGTSVKVSLPGLFI